MTVRGQASASGYKREKTRVQAFLIKVVVLLSKSRLFHLLECRLAPLGRVVSLLAAPGLPGSFLALKSLNYLSKTTSPFKTYAFPQVKPQF